MVNNPMAHKARALVEYARLSARMLKARIARLGWPLFGRPRFSGAYRSREAACAAIPTDILDGYNHAAVAEISFETMSQVALWDYPIIYWLQCLLPHSRTVLDAGGHMGTKYRAFSRFADLKTASEWVIYDVPEIVRAGRERAATDGLSSLKFIDDLAEAPAADILLASGLLQYLDLPFPNLLQQLPVLPRHLLINKIAMRKGETVVTLENFGVALVPYQIRNRNEFLSSMAALGYRIVDEWQIPSLCHVISTHPELGRSENAGFYMTLER